MKTEKQIRVMLKKLKKAQNSAIDYGFCPLCGLIFQEQSCEEALEWVLGERRASKRNCGGKL